MLEKVDLNKSVDKENYKKLREEMDVKENCSAPVRRKRSRLSSYLTDSGQAVRERRSTA